MQTITIETPLSLSMDRPIRPNGVGGRDLTRDEGTLAGYWILPSVLTGAALWIWGIAALFG